MDCLKWEWGPVSPQGTSGRRQLKLDGSAGETLERLESVPEDLHGQLC